MQSVGSRILETFRLFLKFQNFYSYKYGVKRSRKYKVRVLKNTLNKILRYLIYSIVINSVKVFRFVKKRTVSTKVM